MTLYQNVCDAARSTVQYQVKYERNEFEKRAQHYDKNAHEDQVVLEQCQMRINDPDRVDSMLCIAADNILRKEEKASCMMRLPIPSPEMVAAIKGPKKIDRSNDSSGYKAFKKIFPIIEKAEAYHDHMAGVQYMLEMQRNMEKLQKELKEQFPKAAPPPPMPPLPDYDYANGMTTEVAACYRHKCKEMDDAIVVKTEAMKAKE